MVWIMGSHLDAIEAAWQRMVADCGCADLYFCPASDDVECPRHGGFDICCDRPERHVPVPRNIRQAHPDLSIEPDGK